MATDNTDFTLDKNNYATFDALTLKQLIKKRLNDNGVFTDQIFEGSNISAIMDIIAFSYHTLLFYLNNTSSESLFSEASVYENMNRIVKLIDYKPKGFQTSLLSFNATATDTLPADFYTIKRYSYFILNGIYYSFVNDVTFSKATNTVEKLQTLTDNNILYQGRFFELPVKVSTGEDFEIFTMVLKDTVDDTPFFIEDSAIDVYVKDVNSGVYTEFRESVNIFLEGPDAAVYEKRLNENGFYEFKFGNGVFGRRLNEGDEVYIFYLQSDGESGIVSAGQLNGNRLNIFTTPLFEKISRDIYNQENFNFLTPIDIQNIAFSNSIGSTLPKEKESVDEIRNNSQKLLFSQKRLVTKQDYITFIAKNYSNIVKSVEVVSNNEYIDKYIKYFYNLGIDKPNKDPRFLFNQVNFSTSNQFNNINIFMVPRIRTVDSDNIPYFLSTAQKNTIISSLIDYKMVNSEIVVNDPIYIAFTVGLGYENEELVPEISETSYLVIKRRTSSRISQETIKKEANNIIIDYFNDLLLGSTVSILELKGRLLSIEGVNDVITRRDGANGRREVPTVSLLYFNLIYPDVDIDVIGSDYSLDYFKYPFLYNQTLIDNILVEDE